MKKTILLLIAALGLSVAHAQTANFHRVKIADSGCSYLAIQEDVSFEKTFSPDGAVVWTTEVTDGKHAYVIICVKFAGPLGMDADGHAVMATSYLDFLKSSVGITQASAPQSGYTIPGCGSAAGVTEQWTDANGQHYEVKAWCDEKYMAVMMVYANTVDAANPDVLAYLDGFRYPGCE